jgi:farnesyl diphosphate synthase
MMGISMENQEKFNKMIMKIFENYATEFNEHGLVEVYDRLKKIYFYNLFNGKKIRGLALVNTAFKISELKNIVMSETDIEEVMVLGCVVEILQAFSIIIDDIMDQSIKRRHRLCWFRNVFHY